MDESREFNGKILGNIYGLRFSSQKLVQFIRENKLLHTDDNEQICLILIGTHLIVECRSKILSEEDDIWLDDAFHTSRTFCYSLKFMQFQF